jgi:HEAT repeat protein
LSFVRAAAATALGQLGDARAVQPLVDALVDQDKNVRRHAAAALERLGEPQWIQWVKGHDSDFSRLGASRDVRVLEPLVKALADEGLYLPLRAEAAAGLGQLGNARAVEPLLNALVNKHSPVRGAAAQALGQLGDARAAEPLIKTLADQEDYVRGAAAQALGQLGDVRAVEPLIKTLADQKDYVRGAAAAALGQLGDVRAVEPLVNALVDQDNPVRLAVATALRQLGQPHWSQWFKGDDDDFSRLGTSRNARAFELLIQALSERDWRMHKAAAKALGELGDARAVEPLIKTLADKSCLIGDVREAAAEALGRLGDTRAVEPLMQSLSGHEIAVRKAAAAALGRLGDARAVEPLIKALKEKREDVRETAAMALGQFGDTHAVEALIETVSKLPERDWAVRKTAAAALIGLLSHRPGLRNPKISAVFRSIREPHGDHHEDRSLGTWRVYGSNDCHGDHADSKHDDHGIGLEIPPGVRGADF